jgi:eukaryotic-like serine/threonine-protein kinase
VTLAAGTKLGPYEVVSPLGAGGMGEVYKARDIRLGREVAVKVLPERLSLSPEARQRFEREARTISQLSHPHICALYDVGHQDGVEYLVMELLEGETLAERLSKGPLPLEQALRYGTEIADALEKAHRQGIVHRDLKPGNVMLTRAGVKLLDFGLARAIAPAAPADLTSSPTVAGEEEITREGVILGTLQYMAPEQLEAKAADARTDIFALGVVLYEMAAGKKAFSGESRASLISSIMSSQPQPISQFQPMSPPTLDRLVRTCLAKDPEERWQSARDVETELAWILEADAPAEVPAAPRAGSRGWMAGARIIAGSVLLAAAALVLLPRLRGKPDLQVIRLEVLPPEGTEFALEEAPRISPDGRELAFVAVDSAGRARLYVRPLDALAARLLPDTDGASMPFWAPDSRSLGFFAASKLKAISISGGEPRVLCDAPVARGGTWSRNGSIVFVPSPPEPPSIISASGGSPKSIELGPMLEVPRHFFPDYLPDGRRYLYLSVVPGDPKKRSINVTVAGSKQSEPVVRSSWSGVFAPPDFVLFRSDMALMAQRFDTKRLKPLGEPFVVAPEVGLNPITWQALLSVSDNGILAYQSAAGTKTQLTWLDRNGREIGTVGEPGIYNSLSLSPDDKRVAYDRADPKTGDVDVWLTQTERGVQVPVRFTFASAVSFFPVWYPDGSRVVFSTLHGPPQLYQKVTNGAGDEELLLRSDSAKIPTGFSPDGRFLVYAVLDPGTEFDLWVLPLFGDRRPFPYLRTPAAEIGGQISPNGRWMVYASNESGAYEVYVRPFPIAPGKWQISRDGGSQPRWRRDGKELFYISNDRRIMAVDVRADLSAFEAGVPRALFDAHVSNIEGSNPWSQYAVSADGQRFLVNRLVTEGPSSPITVMINWPAVGKKSVE